MIKLVHDMLKASALRAPQKEALKYRNEVTSYAELAAAVQKFAYGLLAYRLGKQERVGIYAEKRPETVIAMLGAAAAGGVYVPINPLLKPEQVGYIVRDCDVRVLVTSHERLPSLLPILQDCPSVHTVIIMGDAPQSTTASPIAVIDWQKALNHPATAPHTTIDQDMAAILYTSGSTGQPKGVVLSHRNIITGAYSVAEYLELTEDDRLLCVLPFAFDYGMNQLMTMLLVGGTAVLMNYLFPNDILTLLSKEKITGLAAVPPLWIQLSHLTWSPEITNHLRYITNSGGHMPLETLTKLRGHLPRTKPYLMYGLTEAFRSTYLPPDQIDIRPGSMGKAIPNAEILVVRPDGTLCDTDEEGELVHRGSLVSLGYWNNPEKTAERFKPAPGQNRGLPLTEMAVWSGDTVKRDADGFLYFVGRKDEMIKTSGYRVSPTEIEAVLYSSKIVSEAAAFGADHPTLGQAIIVIALAGDGATVTAQDIRKLYETKLPAYMIPAHIELVSQPLPRNPNGKIDRKKLSTDYVDFFVKA